MSAKHAVVGDLTDRAKNMCITPELPAEEIEVSASLQQQSPEDDREAW